MPAAKSSKKVDPKGGKAPAKKKDAGGGGCGKAKKKKCQRARFATSFAMPSCSTRLRMTILQGDPPSQADYSVGGFRALQGPSFCGQASLRELLAKGSIRCVVKHGSQLVYTRATSKATEAMVMDD
uniref:Uncharacterized protein n=1 Tax=Ditylenchus dipsaci TaxID=166011 RepID=A0A915CTI5_9BILA